LTVTLNRPYVKVNGSTGVSLARSDTRPRERVRRMLEAPMMIVPHEFVSYVLTYGPISVAACVAYVHAGGEIRLRGGGMELQLRRWRRPRQ
jgi:hypothetical protein